MEDKVYAMSKNKKYRIIKYYNDFFARWCYRLEEYIELLWVLKFWDFKSDDALCINFNKWIKDYDMDIVE